MEVITGGKGTEKPKKKPNLFLRLLAFLVTVILVLGAVALVVYRDELNFDAIKRWYAYRNLERSDSGQAESFSINGTASDLLATVGDSLLLCASNSVRIYSGSGTMYADKTVALEQPAADVMGKYALVYDVGGQNLHLFSNREEVFSLSLAQESMLLSAGVNQHGWFAAVTQESGHKGTATVYDNSGAPVIQLNLSSRFILDAAVAPDDRSVALVTMGLSGGTLESRVELYRLDRSEEEAEPDWSCPLDGGTVLELRWDDSGIWALGESGVSLVSASGTLEGFYSYGGRYLKAFSLDGDGTAALLLGKYRAGSSAVLVVVSKDGAAQASLSVDEQVLSFSAAGRYIAVLTAGRLDLYDQDLDLYSTVDGTQGASRVLMRSDGTAMLIGGGSAHLYVP